MAQLGGEFSGLVNRRIDFASQLSLRFDEGSSDSRKGHVANDEYVNVAR